MSETNRVLIIGFLGFIPFAFLAKARGDSCGYIDLNTIQLVDISALDNPAHQGIAWSGTNFYSSKGDCCPIFHPDIHKFDSNWSELSEVKISYTGRVECGSKESHSHVGDMVVGPDGFLYAPLSDYNPPGCGGAGVGAENFQIVRWTTPGVSYDWHWDVTSMLSILNGGDLAGLAFRGNDLYGIEWRNHDGNPAHIYKFTLNGTNLKLDASYEIRLCLKTVF